MADRKQNIQLYSKKRENMRYNNNINIYISFSKGHVYTISKPKYEIKD